MIQIYKAYHGAYVVDVQNGPLILIDGGRPRTGTFALLPMFKRRLKRDLVDLIVLTHFHDNHTGGAADILEAMPVARVVSPGVYSTGQGLGRPADLIEQDRIDAAVAQQGIPHDWVTENDVLNDGNGHTIIQHGQFKLEAIGRYPNAPAGTPNDGLCHLVLRVTYGDFRLIHPTDINSVGFWADLGNPKADVLFLGHHGDKTAQRNEFIDPVDPDLVIVGDHQKDDSERDFYTNKGIQAWFYSVEGKPRVTAHANGSWSVARERPFTAPRLPS